MVLSLVLHCTTSCGGQGRGTDPVEGCTSAVCYPLHALLLFYVADAASVSAIVLIFNDTSHSPSQWTGKMNTVHLVIK